VTALATGGGGNVAARLARGRGAVMAARAIAIDRDISVKFGGQPVGETALVACGAIVRRCDVIG